VRAGALALLVLVLAAPLCADEARPPMLRDVGIDQHPGAALPLDLAFRDESGKTVALRDYFADGKPVLLSLVYFGCPMLCGQSLNGIAASLKALSLEPGKEFTVLAVSFDAADTPAVASDKKAQVVARYGRPATAAGWHFLVGEQASIDALTQAVGFRYTRDATNRQFAHVPAAIVMTPGGVISRYFYGIEPAPRDLRLGLVEASANRIGTVVDQLLLFCFHYDPANGKYGAAVMGAVRAGGVLTLVALGTFVALSRRREAPRS
jgi:protein SCO1/2